MTGRAGDEVSTESPGVVRRRFDWSTVSPSAAAVETVVAFTGRSPEEIEPLYETVDPDAMDVLVAGSEPEAAVSLTLTLGDHEIHVRSGGDVVVSDAGK